MKEESCEWESDWYNSKGITFLMKNVEEKNRNRQKKQKIWQIILQQMENVPIWFSSLFFFERQFVNREKLNRRLTRSRKIWQIILQLVGAVWNFSVVVTTKSKGIFFP